MFIGKRRKHILGDQEHGFGTIPFSSIVISEDFNHSDPPDMSLNFSEGFEE